MKRPTKLFLFLALLVALLTTACGARQGGTPTAIGTLLPSTTELSSTPFGPTVTVGTTPTATGSGLIVPADTSTPGLATAVGGSGGAINTQTVPTQAHAIPVTGQDIMLVECQFCVDAKAHALLVLPDTATFKITSPVPNANTTTDVMPTCTTVEINNGSQVVLCSGPQLTSLVVNICTDASHCTDFPVNLLSCPLTQGGSVGPAVTQTPGTGATGGTGGAAATATTLPPGAGIDTATPVPGVSVTATATP